jgi:hypothetical protein
MSSAVKIFFFKLVVYLWVGPSCAPYTIARRPDMLLLPRKDTVDSDCCLYLRAAPDWYIIPLNHYLTISISGMMQRLQVLSTGHPVLQIWWVMSWFIPVLWRSNIQWNPGRQTPQLHDHSATTAIFWGRAARSCRASPPPQKVLWPPTFPK